MNHLFWCEAEFFKGKFWFYYILGVIFTVLAIISVGSDYIVGQGKKTRD